MEWSINDPKIPRQRSTLWNAAAALLAYAAFWGGLSDLASISTLGLAVLMPGAGALLLAAILPAKRPLRFFLWAVALTVILWTGIRFSQITVGFQLQVLLEPAVRQHLLRRRISW